jgi:hypothetical protein
MLPLRLTPNGPLVEVETWRYPIAVVAQDNIPIETHLIVSVFDQ